MKKAKQFKRKKVSGSRVFNRQTSTDRSKLYDRDWQVYRHRFLYYNTQCYACGSTEQLHVDHLVAHKGDAELFKKLTNHIPLCHKCHSHVTGLFDRFKIPRTQEKLEWINKKRASLGLTTSVKVMPRYSR